MEAILQALLPCCLGRRTRSNRQNNKTPDERTPLIAEASGQQDAAESASREQSQSVLPQPSYDAEALRGIMNDVQSKFINLDSSNLFSTLIPSVAPLSDASAPTTNDKSQRPLTLVRHLKLHIAEEAAFEDAQGNLASPAFCFGEARLSGGGGGVGRRKRSLPATSASSVASGQAASGNGAGAGTVGMGITRFPSVHSLKTLARSATAAVISLDDSHHTSSTSVAYDTLDPQIFHTAREHPTSHPSEPTTKLVDIWGQSPNEHDAVAFLKADHPSSRTAAAANSSNAMNSSKKKKKKKKSPQSSTILSPSTTSLAVVHSTDLSSAAFPSVSQSQVDPSQKMTKTQISMIENETFEKLNHQLLQNPPLIQVWRQDD